MPTSKNLGVLAKKNPPFRTDISDRSTTKERLQSRGSRRDRTRGHACATGLAPGKHFTAQPYDSHLNVRQQLLWLHRLAENASLGRYEKIQEYQRSSAGPVPTLFAIHSDVRVRSAFHGAASSRGSARLPPPWSPTFT